MNDKILIKIFNFSLEKQKKENRNKSKNLLKKNVNLKKRFFIKSSLFSFFLIHAFKANSIKFFENLTINTIKFVRKNKKIWILSQNDLRKF